MAENITPENEQPATGTQDPRVEQLEAENAELVNDIRRLNADFVNFRNRSRNDIEKAGAVQLEKLSQSLIPVLDDLEAMRAAGDLVGPFANITDKMERVLADRGLVRHGTAGEVFDPAFHEAVLQIPSEDVDSGCVVQVLRYGYLSNGRVLRATQVIVAE